jgi:hypothetical protein
VAKNELTYCNEPLVGKGREFLPRAPHGTVCEKLNSYGALNYNILFIKYQSATDIFFSKLFFAL